MNVALSVLRAEIKAEIWPDGEPENLVASVDKFFIDGLIHLQRWVDCLRENHVNVYPQCATYSKCGLTVLDAPRGTIHKVYTIQDDAWCDPVRYTQDTLDSILCWSRRFMEIVTAPANEGLPPLPGGYRYPEASTDSIYGRALRGKWALDRNRRLFVAPWMQSRESLVIEWSGLKRKYSDADLVPDEEDLRRALRLWVQKEFARDFEGDIGRSRVFEDAFQTVLADLIYECREETRLRPTPVCEAELEYLSDYQTLDDNPDNAEVPTVFGAVADYGNHSAESWDVASLVKGWNPQAIITAGDNAYVGGSVDFDAAVGWLYRSFIYPYKGSQPLWDGETEATANQFWPALGNHDLDVLSEYQEFFTLPGNERFYDVEVGACHFFFLNSGRKTDGTELEPAGTRYVDTQAAWLRGRLLQSTARWKIVVCHHPPYSSYRYPGHDWMRWPFKQWGADLLISGHNHNYERIEVDGFPYLIIGLGGASLYPFGAEVVDGSVVRYAGDYGALKGTATCAQLKLEWITRTGAVIDTLTLT